MAATTVQSLLDKASTVIQDRTNIRWTHDELRGWLNEAYQQIVLLRPDANTNTEMVALKQGSKQEIPASGVSFITLTRNAGGTAIRYIDRAVLDDQLPQWHIDSPSGVIEHFVHDTNNPKVYYVYPPAEEDPGSPGDSTAQVEIVYSSVPTPHEDATGTILLDDRYAPAILDYMLYRAYQKDADYAANDQRSASAYSTFLNSLGVQSATPTTQS